MNTLDTDNPRRWGSGIVPEQCSCETDFFAWFWLYLIRGIDLSGADLSGVDLREAKLDDQTVIDDKWRLVWELVNQGGQGRDLRGIDLSGADLSGVDLRETKLDDQTVIDDKWRLVWELMNQGGQGRDLRESGKSQEAI